MAIYNNNNYLYSIIYLQKRFPFIILDIINLIKNRNKGKLKIKDKEISKKLQVKLNHHIRKFENYFTRPEYKFIYQMVFGIIKSGELKISRIAKSLNEVISFQP